MLTFLQAKASDWHPTHNIYCILDEDSANMEPFKEIIPFLKESRIAKAFTEKHKIYESHVRMFCKYVRHDKKIRQYIQVQQKVIQSLNLILQSLE
ncbi:hypothetical protein Hanom_Chr11g01024781 [Helianthus anomalus]